MSSAFWLGVPLLLATGPLATLRPAEPALGERAVLTLSEAPTDSTRRPTGLNVQVIGTEDPRVFEVVPVRVGRVGVVLGERGDTLAWDVPGSLEAADPSTLRPLRGVGDLGPVWWPVHLASALLAAWLLAWWLRRRRVTREAESEPPEPAHVAALRRLAEIEGEGWVERGEFERFYVEASHALRAYLDGRYRVDSLDATTEETVARLRRHGHPVGEVDTVAALLGVADGVKFAARPVTAAAAREWLERTRAFVLATRVEVVWSTPEALREERRFAPEVGR